MEKPTFALVAFSYSRASAAAAAYERVLTEFTRCQAGDSLYRFQLGGDHTLAVLTWRATPARIKAIAALPWGDGVPVVLPPDAAQQLALRSLEAAPPRPHRVRRVFRDPSGHVVADRELPDA